MKKNWLFGLVAIGLLTGCQSSTQSASPQHEDSQTAIQELIPAAKGPKLQRNYYEIFVGSYYDSNDDGIGDLTGITEKLDYLNTGEKQTEDDLKVNGLWLTPVMPSPTYHKYDVMDYYAIDPQFGNLAEFEKLVQEADQRGIAIIMDLVLNHTSDQHPWFQHALKSFSPDATEEDKRYRDWYVFKEDSEDGFTPVPGQEGWYYEARFWSGMPDLNLANEEVKAEILKITQFWLDKGVAGFRLDATSHYFEKDTAKNTEFLKWLTTEVRQQKSDVYLVGEAWEDELVVEEMYASGLNSFFDFMLSQADGIGNISEAVKYGSGGQLSQAVYDYNVAIKAENDRALDAVFLSNHDNTRSAEELETLEEKKMAASTYLLLPGNPFIYYGEEVGLTGIGADEDKRLPMPFDPAGKGQPKPAAGASYEAKTDGGTVAEQLEDPDSLLRWYQKILRVKSSYLVIGAGDFTIAENGNDSLSIFIYEGKQAKAVVIHNFDPEAEAEWVLPEELADLQLAETLDIHGEDAELVDGRLRMPGYSTAVLVKK